MRTFLSTWLVLAVVVRASVAQELIGTVQNAQLVLIDNVSISARSSGVVLSNAVVPGKKVKKGELLVVLDSQREESQVFAAEKALAISELEANNDIDVEYAAKSIELNETIYLRVQSAFSSFEKAISRSEVERQKLEMEQAILQHQQTLHTLRVAKVTAGLRIDELAIARISLDNRRIVSPLDGTVVDVESQVGEWVSEGEVVARVVNLSKLRVEAYLPARLLTDVTHGQSVEFSSSVGSLPHTAAGSISFVSPEINPVNQDFKVWAEIENTDMLLVPGMVGELNLYR